MKTTLRILAVLFMVSGLLACTPTEVKTGGQSDESDSDSRLRLQDYFPLRVGAKWKYKIYSFIEKKNIAFVRQIVRKKGNKYFDNAKSQYHYDTYGVREGLRYLLKYPLKRGNRWVSVVGITDVEKYTIVATDRTVRVPAGVYKSCIVVRSQKQVSNRDTLEAHFYFAPQVGFVKITMALESNGSRVPQWTYELVSFFAGKDTDTTTAVGKTQPAKQ